MLTAFRNVLLNPKFDLVDYGAGPFNATGYCATRWKLERTGTANAVTAAPGTTASNAGIAKWLRSRACLDVVVTAADYNTATDTATIRQRVEDGDRHGRAVARLTVVAFGPAGGSFKIGFAGRRRTLSTLGDSGAGTPLPAFQVVEELVPDPSTSYLTAEIFSAPADLDATYKIAFVQLEYRHHARVEPEAYELRSPAVERLLCARYVWPIPRWTPCQSTSSSQVVVPVVVPVEMTATPSIVAGVSSVDFVQQTNASVFTSAAPSPSLDATHKSSHGGRVVFAAFTSPSALGSGVHGMIGTARSALLEAELG
jgi:hypothetical protein